MGVPWHRQALLGVGDAAKFHGSWVGLGPTCARPHSALYWHHSSLFLKHPLRYTLPLFPFCSWGMEVQRGSVTCPISHSQGRVQLELKTLLRDRGLLKGQGPSFPIAGVHLGLEDPSEGARAEASMERNLD